MDLRQRSCLPRQEALLTYSLLFPYFWLATGYFDSFPLSFLVAVFLGAISEKLADLFSVDAYVRMVEVVLGPPVSSSSTVVSASGDAHQTSFSSSSSVPVRRAEEEAHFYDKPLPPEPKEEEEDLGRKKETNGHLEESSSESEKEEEEEEVERVHKREVEEIPQDLLADFEARDEPVKAEEPFHVQREEQEEEEEEKEQEREKNHPVPGDDFGLLSSSEPVQVKQEPLSDSFQADPPPPPRPPVQEDDPPPLLAAAQIKQEPVDPDYDDHEEDDRRHDPHRDGGHLGGRQNGTSEYSTMEAADDNMDSFGGGGGRGGGVAAREEEDQERQLFHKDEGLLDFSSGVSAPPAVPLETFDSVLDQQRKRGEEEEEEDPFAHHHVPEKQHDTEGDSSSSPFDDLGTKPVDMETHHALEDFEMKSSDGSSNEPPAVVHPQEPPPPPPPATSSSLLDFEERPPPGEKEEEEGQRQQTAADPPLAAPAAGLVDFGDGLDSSPVDLAAKPDSPPLQHHHHHDDLADFGGRRDSPVQQHYDPPPASTDLGDFGMGRPDSLVQQHQVADAADFGGDLLSRQTLDDFPGKVVDTENKDDDAKPRLSLNDEEEVMSSEEEIDVGGDEKDVSDPLDAEKKAYEAKRLREDEGDPWSSHQQQQQQQEVAATTTSVSSSNSGMLLLGADDTGSSSVGGGGAGGNAGGDDISHRAVFGDDEDPDEKELDLSNKGEAEDKAGSDSDGGREGMDEEKHGDGAQHVFTKDFDADDPLAHEAATKIQAAFKGYRARNELRE